MTRFRRFMAYLFNLPWPPKRAKPSINDRLHKQLARETGWKGSAT